MLDLPPLAVFLVGLLTVVGLILVFRLNAFLALITAALVVSLLGPGETAQKVVRVAEAFGDAAGKIGIVIALAAIIGQCMIESGAADRIVRSLLRVFGMQRAPWALMSSGFVLSVPVFFDTVFYLLVPLARSFYRQTGTGYLRSLIAICCGAALTHTLVPPTPGPLTMAVALKVDIGTMILMGSLIAIPAAVLSNAFGIFYARRMVILPPGDGAELEQPRDEILPGLGVSLAPVVLPVVLIGAHTATSTLAKGTGPAAQSWQELARYTALLGNPNFALLLSTGIALWLVRARTGSDKAKIPALVEHALMSGGVIILITAAGAAFGAMLKAVGIGQAIQDMAGTEANATLSLLWIGFGIAALLKVAQGSGTASMVVGSSMMAAMVGQQHLPFHPVYLATAIGSGSLVGSWMNDSGFWIFAKMGGLTEREALKVWPAMLSFLGIVSMLTTVLLALVFPLAS